MLYVLADDHGTYYYDPADEGSIGHTGKTNADFALADAEGNDIQTDPFWARPSGAHVIVFKDMPDGYQFAHDFHGIGEAVPSRRFNPRPAREGDLDDAVFVADWSVKREEWKRWKFTQQPTPTDAFAVPS